MAHRTTAYRICIGIFLGMGALAAWAATNAPAPSPEYRSPFDVRYSPDGKQLAIADRTGAALVLADPGAKSVQQRIALAGKTGMLAWSADSSKAYVAEYDAGTIAEVSVAQGKIIRRLTVGRYPVGVAIAPRRQLLLAGNTGLSDVSVVDLSSGQEKSRVQVLREPFWIAVTPDESLAAVSNLLPVGAGTDPELTASVSLIDLQTLQRVADIKLPPNTTCIRQIAISPDGKWAYAVHTLGRTTLPATQLDRGWVNTNALSIIDLNGRSLYATVLLDNLSEGAADPWGVALAGDGSTLWITLAGVHQLARIDLLGLHKLLAGEAFAPPSGRALPSTSIWMELRANAAERANTRMRLVNDLAALYVAEVMVRLPLPGNGPRGISIAPDGRHLAIGQYFSSNVLLMDAEHAQVASTISLGGASEPDPVRLGERVFNDATYTFQHWLSCTTCHPNEGRVDGLNWDMPNDGIGNPKSAKSLLQAHLTPPSMWRGIREGMDSAAAAGFRFAMFQPSGQDLSAVQAYLRSLQPQQSPYRLPNGNLSEKASHGKAIFETDKVGCAHCHSGPQFTNGKSYNVGSHGEFDPDDHTQFDTPSLIELWRTAPYLHDGRAASLRDLFTTHNPKDHHGNTSHLSQEQLDDLVEYLLSL